MAQSKKEQNFESAMARIEEIAGRMEDGKLPLEELLAAYEEGLRLIGFCNGRLAEAEMRLEKITRNSAGQVQGTAPSTPPGESVKKDDSTGAETAPVQLF